MSAPTPAAESFWLRHAAQLLEPIGAVEQTDIVEDSRGDPTLEATIHGRDVPADVLQALAAYGCVVDADATGTQGDDPATTILVARAGGMR